MRQIDADALKIAIEDNFVGNSYDINKVIDAQDTLAEPDPDTISRKAVTDAIEKCHKQCCRIDSCGDEWIHYETTLNEVESIPPAQPKKGVIEQIKWERDVAIEQLKNLGYGLGEKIRAEKDCISRQAAIDIVTPHDDNRAMRDALEELQPVAIRLESKNTVDLPETEGSDPSQIAAQIIHDAIDNTTFAEEAYPGIKEQLHRSVEEWEKLQPVFTEIAEEYKKACKISYINKPLAYALHEVWKKHDRRDTKRNE